MKVNKSGDVVISHVLDLIMKGEIPLGGKMPSTENLAKITGTGIISAREAVQSLAYIGLVEIKHGRGIFFTDGLPIIEDLLAARMVIESETVMMATGKLRPVDLEKLSNLLHCMENDALNNDSESFSDLDMEFHLLIGKLAGNRILSKMLENIKVLLHYQQAVMNRRSPDIIKRSLRRHREIFNAMRKGKAETAKSIMIKHIKEVIESWKTFGPVSERMSN